MEFTIPGIVQTQLSPADLLGEPCKRVTYPALLAAGGPKCSTEHLLILLDFRTDRGQQLGAGGPRLPRDEIVQQLQSGDGAGEMIAEVGSQCLSHGWALSVRDDEVASNAFHSRSASQRQ